MMVHCKTKNLAWQLLVLFFFFFNFSFELFGIGKHLMLITCWFMWTDFVRTPYKMSRPILLAFLLMILIITSQFEWKQQLVVDLDTAPSISQNQQQISKREESVKEKVWSLSWKKLLAISAFVFAFVLLIFWLVENNN